MPRRRLVEAPSSAGLGDWLDESVPKTPRTRAMSDYEVAKSDAETRSRSGDWASSNAAAFVGLYAVCHERLYRVEPLELKAKAEFRAAARQASMLLARFNNDGELFARFIVWTWERQKRRSEWFKRKNEEMGEKGDTFRMGWRLQFSPKTETDFRVEISSKRAR